MSTQRPTDRSLARVLRRETHSPRTVAMIIAVVLVVLAVVYLGTETVLSLAGVGAWLAAPSELLRGLAEAPTNGSSAIVIAVGVAVAVVGIALVAAAVTPGRLPKHGMATQDGSVVLVDNGVIASSLAQHVSDALGIDRRRLTVGVAHRRVDVTVRPEAGIPLDLAEVRSVCEAEVASYQLSPSVSTVVRRRIVKEDER